MEVILLERNKKLRAKPVLTFTVSPIWPS